MLYSYPNTLQMSRWPRTSKAVQWAYRNVVFSATYYNIKGLIGSYPPPSPKKIFIEIITKNKRFYNNPVLFEFCEITHFRFNDP
jgi:hypothetical protein